MGGLLTWTTLKSFNSAEVKADADEALKDAILESDKSWIADELPQTWDPSYLGRDPKNLIEDQTDRRETHPDFSMEPVGGPRF